MDPPRMPYRRRDFIVGSRIYTPSQRRVFVCALRVYASEMITVCISFNLFADVSESRMQGPSAASVNVYNQRGRLGRSLYWRMPAQIR